MITNLPSAEQLHRSAMRAYFDSWSLLLSIVADFDTHFEPGVEWNAERSEYLERSQADLQVCLVGIQLANELALKARITEVSPFLLIFGSDQRFSKQPSDVDFADLRTLDAYELIGATNTFCPTPLSDDFVRDYEEVRRLRNKIVHLGSVDQQLEPDILLKRMVRQYAELWPCRPWLVERLSHAGRTRHSVFHDGKYSSAEGEVFSELDASFSRISRTYFKRLIGFEKTRRYVCLKCVDNSGVRRMGFDLALCRTAFIASSERVTCAMCEESFDFTRTDCSAVDCPGNVVHHAAGDDPVCLTCGEYLD
jgi:hypothetical protein